MKGKLPDLESYTPAQLELIINNARALLEAPKDEHDPLSSLEADDDLTELHDTWTSHEFDEECVDGTLDLTVPVTVILEDGYGSEDVCVSGGCDEYIELTPEQCLAIPGVQEAIAARRERVAKFNARVEEIAARYGTTPALVRERAGIY